MLMRKVVLDLGDWFSLLVIYLKKKKKVKFLPKGFKGVSEMCAALSFMEEGS